MKNSTPKIKNNHYVDNALFQEKIIEYRLKCNDAKEKGLIQPRLTEYLGNCIQLIAEQFSTKGNFSGYSWREEMIMDGVENCIRYFDNYDPMKYTNPFGYFSKIILYAFIRRIDKEKKQHYLKHKLYASSYAFEEVTGMLSEAKMSEPGNEEYRSTIINNYESSVERKKQKMQNRIEQSKQLKIQQLLTSEELAEMGLDDIPLDDIVIPED